MSQICVLIVDDRVENLLSLGAAIAEIDAEVVTAQNGEEALRALLRREFAVILLDVQMPGMDGFEVARLIRSNRRTAYTPIVFVSAGDGMRERLTSAYGAGAVDFLFKPVDPVILRHKVGIFVELYRQRVQVTQQAAALEASRQELASANTELAAKTEALTASERELRALNVALNSQVGERTLALRLANQRLQAMIYSASHNLKTPLRTILSLVDILRDDLGEGLPPPDADYLDRITRAGERTWALVESIGRLSALAGQPPQVVELDLAVVARRVMAQKAAERPDRPFEFVCPPAAPAVADRNQAEMLLEVLLDNAWKFTGGTAHPIIEFGVVATGACTAWFVRDNGLGFEGRHAERLFGWFQRLTDTEHFAGEGVGLAIARQIVDMHHGWILAESDLGQGATFTFSLDSSAPAPATETVDRSLLDS